MTIYKDRDAWRVDVFARGKRVKSRSGFKSKREAKKWHDIHLGALINNADDRVAAKAFKIEELLDQFERLHLPTIRQGTASRYLIDLNQRIKPYFCGMRLDMIAARHIEEFRDSLMKKLSLKSVNNCVALLKGVFTKGVAWGMMSGNPAQHLALLKLPKAKFSWWDKEEYIHRFLEVAREDRYYLAYRLALDMGLRLGEIIGLSKADVNLERCQVHIHRQWLDKEQCFGPPKQNKERYISFSSTSDLKGLLAEAIEKSSHKEAIFVTRTGRRLGARKLSGYHFKRAVELAGVPMIRFHDLRHTFASWYMIKCDDAWSLKGILGHADIQTTQRYAHLSSAHQKVPSFDWAK